MTIKQVRQKYPEAVNYTDEQLERYIKLADMMAEITLQAVDKDYGKN